jgi:glycosyltransferase 2 family protein
MSGATQTTRDERHGLTSKPWWPWLKRGGSLVFFILVAYLLFTQARTVEWDEVIDTVRSRPLQDIFIACAFAAASFALYSCFDLIGRHTTGHRLAVPKVMLVNFISYIFNLNLGSLVGGVAFRYRLYSRLGLEAAVTTRVVFMSMLTNWLGYVLLAGLVYLLQPPPLPPDWDLDTLGLRVMGGTLCIALLAYILCCALLRKRTWNIKGHDFTLPSLRLTALQLLMSSANWLLITCAIYFLLEQKIAFLTVLSVMLVAAIAGVITHVPAGLGVLETVFVALLSEQMPKSALLAALIAYRAIYYLMPLAVATLLYLVMEARTRQPG